MKELSTYNRVAGYLNRIFDLMNQTFFENALSRPTITIQHTPKSYGHFSLRDDTWISKKGATHEINIGAGTLARPIEAVCATLLHEMVHYHNYVNGVQDCSRGGTYHNCRFRDSAEEHGLIVDHHDKYGWTITSPSDRLLQFCLDNDLSDILLNRNVKEHYGYLLAIAIMCGVSIFVMFSSLYADLRHSQVERELQLVRERSIRLQEQLHRRTTHQAIREELARRGINLQDPQKPKEVVED